MHTAHISFQPSTSDWDIHIVDGGSVHTPKWAFFELPKPATERVRERVSRAQNGLFRGVTQPQATMRVLKLYNNTFNCIIKH